MQWMNKIPSLSPLRWIDGGGEEVEEKKMGEKISKLYRTNTLVR
jgi:hypothetical protein